MAGNSQRAKAPECNLRDLGVRVLASSLHEMTLAEFDRGREHVVRIVIKVDAGRRRFIRTQYQSRILQRLSSQGSVEV
jgi:hypothetical protein